MKLVYFILALIFIKINATAQIFDTQYLRIAENQVNSDPFLNFNDFDFNSKKRVLECYVQFRDGTKNYNPKCNTCWNKILMISCTMNNGSKNSIRLGWRYNGEKDAIELGYYGHMNHIEEPWGDKDPGREYTSLGVFVDTWDNIQVELVLSKGLYYVRAGEVATQVHRDVFSWSPNGENTIVHINAFFGDKGSNYLSNDDDLPAPEDMEFRVSDIKIDDEDYFDEHQYNKAPILRLANSVFYDDSKQIDYEGSKSIELSADMESTEETGRLPYSYVSSKYSFVVFQNGSHVNFYSPNIIINPGTSIEAGAFIYLGSLNSLKSEEIAFIEDTVDEISFDESESLSYSTKEVKAYLDNDNDFFKIFPIPTIDYLKITTSTESIGQYTVTDINGRFISIGKYYTNTFSIDCTNYSSGTYYITFVQENLEITKQFIKK